MSTEAATAGLLPLVLLLFVTGCMLSDGADAGAGNGKRILPWSEDPRYLAWEGTEPVLLLGAGSDDNLFLQPYIKAELRQLDEAGGNFVRCVFHSRGEDDPLPFHSDSTGGTFDLTRPDSTYWAGLTELLRESRSRDQVVQLEQWWGGAYPNQAEAFREAFGAEVRARTAPYTHLLWEKPAEIDRAVLPFQPRPMVTDLSRTLYRTEAQEQWRLLLGIRDSTNLSAPEYLLTAAALTGHGANPAIVDGTGHFNRTLLGGIAAARHARAPVGNGLNDRALSSIRTIRTIERSFRFWDLRPAPEILLDGSTATAYPTTDGNGNYLVYLDGPSTVRVRLDTRDQPKMQVSVVGYLGTRRTELLDPPYGSVFELSTEDDRGAWLLMRRI